MVTTISFSVTPLHDLSVEGICTLNIELPFKKTFFHPQHFVDLNVNVPQGLKTVSSISAYYNTVFFFLFDSLDRLECDINAEICNKDTYYYGLDIQYMSMNEIVQFV